MRMTRHTVAFLFGIVLLVTACQNPEPTPTPSTIESPSGEFTHTGSGMTFPETVGVFVRGDIDEYDNSGEDISVSYVSRRDLFSATVYVYPANAVTPNGSPPDEQHFAAVKAEIEDAFPEATMLVDDARVTLPNSVGRKTTYRFEAEFAGANRLVLSDAYLFGFEEWFIKYRFTYPESSADAASGNIKELMEFFERS